MARKRNPAAELLLPARDSWESWTGTESGACEYRSAHEAYAAKFGREAQRRILALPASHVWVLPAWLKGETHHLNDMARLHLERLGVNPPGDGEAVQVHRLDHKDGAHLVSIIALKELPTPLGDFTRLPTDVVLHAACRAMPKNTVVIFRELGKLVISITGANGIVYCSPLSAKRLDERALSELNNVCMQLSFQGVLAPLNAIVLWTDEGDLGMIQRITGIPASREDMPSPTLPGRGVSKLMPADLGLEKQRLESRSKMRLMGLSAGAILAAGIAAITVFTSMALRERNMLREKVAAVAPKAARVLDHRQSWEEAAPAVDPERFLTETLLRIMEPPSSSEVTLTHFESTPDRVILRGRTESPAMALDYAREIQDVESLADYAWETPAPVIASDNSATFELKGDRP